MKELTGIERAKIFHEYVEGHISEELARKIVGDDFFEVSEENLEGMKQLFSGDTSRFFAEDVK